MRTVTIAAELKAADERAREAVLAAHPEWEDLGERIADADAEFARISDLYAAAQQDYLENRELRIEAIHTGNSVPDALPDVDLDAFEEAKRRARARQDALRAEREKYVAELELARVAELYNLHEQLGDYRPELADAAEAIARAYLCWESLPVTGPGRHERHPSHRHKNFVLVALAQLYLGVDERLPLEAREGWRQGWRSLSLTARLPDHRGDDRTWPGGAGDPRAPFRPRVN